MKILLTGGTGLIGQSLGRDLVSRGHEIHLLTRNPEQSRTLPYPCRAWKWDALEGPPPSDSLDGVEAVLHFAGESLIGGRWTEKKKRIAVRSRVEGTENLLRAIESMEVQPRVFISASAVGYYGDRGDQELNEENSSAIGFLPDLCLRWEEAALKIQDVSPQTRWSILRLGVVLSPAGGALHEVLPLAQDGLLGPLGGGRNWLSWIHIQDLMEIVHWIIESDSVQGIFNATSPSPITNAQWVEDLNQFYGHRKFLSVPKLVLKAALGEASAVLLESQRAIPVRLLDQGFQFRFPGIREAHESLLPRTAPGERFFESHQWVPAPLNEVFPFFKNPENLLLITPPSFAARLVEKTTERIEEGTRLQYRVRVHGVPMRWESEIRDYRESSGFTDVQARGPFARWEHSHHFESFADGTLITDRLICRFPGGLPGRWTGGLLAMKDIERIFEFRERRLGDYFHGGS